jgi:hypothetical protein
MQKSYTIKFYHTFMVTVGANNEDEAIELAEDQIADYPYDYATSIDYEFVESG